MVISNALFLNFNRITCEMFSQGASKVNISLVVKMEDKDRVIKGLHACFFEGLPFDELS